MVALESFAIASDDGLARGAVAGDDWWCNCVTGLQLVSRNSDVDLR